MKYVFHPQAQFELNQAISYYEECQQGLGLEFSQEVYATIQRIVKFPRAWAPLSTNTRRCITNRFPFGIIYQIKKDHIRIIALMQLNRDPDYWKQRK